MTNDALQFFDAIAQRYDRAYALAGVESKARLSRALKEIRGKTRVLVLGVGTGRELSLLLDNGHTPIGLDFSREMIAKCTHRARPVKLVRHDFWEPLPFDARAFDSVIALHGTLAHPPDGSVIASHASQKGAGADFSSSSIARLARELARVLATDGVLYAEVPAPALIAVLSRGPLVSEEGHALRRSGERSFIHEDTTRGVAIEGYAFDEGAWRAWLAPSFTVETAPLGALELSVTAVKHETRA